MAIKMDQETDNKFKIFKVVLIGDCYVGKDKLLDSLCHSKETGGHVVLAKTFQIYRKQVQLQIWNVSSYDKWFPLCQFYARGASGAMGVYDVTRRSSFENIHRCFSILDPETTIMMLGNKCDMADRREVTKQEGEQLASEKGIRFLETSSKYDVNVEEAFTILANDMLLRREMKRFEQFMTLSEVSTNVLVANTAKPRPILMGNGPRLNFANSVFCHILRCGVEENYHIRVMLVGNGGVGKSTLLRRLLRKPVKIKSTIVRMELMSIFIAAMLTLKPEHGVLMRLVKQMPIG